MDDVNRIESSSQDNPKAPTASEATPTPTPSPSPSNNPFLPHPAEPPTPAEEEEEEDEENGGEFADLSCLIKHLILISVPKQPRTTPGGMNASRLPTCTRLLTSNPSPNHNGAVRSRIQKNAIRRPAGRRGCTKRNMQQKLPIFLLIALEQFITELPPIPVHRTNGRLSRDMNEWVVLLQQPQYHNTWDTLMNFFVKHTTSPFQADSQQWDRVLCRYIVHSAIVRSVRLANHQLLHTPSPINRPTTKCLPYMHEKSTLQFPVPSPQHKCMPKRTFRDLFRERCRQSSIKMPLP